MHNPIPTLILNYNLELKKSHTQLHSQIPTLTLTLNRTFQLQQLHSHSHSSTHKIFNTYS